MKLSQLASFLITAICFVQSVAIGEKAVINKATPAFPLTQAVNRSEHGLRGSNKSNENRFDNQNREESTSGKEKLIRHGTVVHASTMTFDGKTDTVYDCKVEFKGHVHYKGLGKVVHLGPVVYHAGVTFDSKSSIEYHDTVDFLGEGLESAVKVDMKAFFGSEIQSVTGAVYFIGNDIVHHGPVLYRREVEYVKPTLVSYLGQTSYARHVSYKGGSVSYAKTARYDAEVNYSALAKVLYGTDAVFKGHEKSSRTK